MKRDYKHENFEEFLKRSADNLRMKAPDRVWENLAGKLNKDRRRFGTGLSAFLLLASVLGYLTISTNTKQSFITKQTVSTSTTNTAKSGTDVQLAVTQPLRSSNFSGEKKGNRVKTYSVVGTGNALGSIIATPGQLTNKQTTEVIGNELPAFNPSAGIPVDDYPATETGTQPAQAESSAKPAFLLSHDAAPWSIESVTNTFKPKHSRFSTEYHFTPTISYRKLSENKSYLRTASFFNSPSNYAALYGSVSDMVTHKPDIGFELGLTEKYAVSQKVRVRAGLQFNVNRYDIKAFQSPFALATIALNRRGSAVVDSVFTLSNYSNVDGSSNKSNWLQNLSFQVSAPVGVEVTLAGNKKMQFGIATTVQPTYILGDRAYLITTDYKNYSQVPWLLRRWNVNTAFETFVAYQTGKTRWQVGPQVRYQLLSSFISNYPVKENLFDFGLKIGVSLNK